MDARQLASLRSLRLAQRFLDHHGAALATVNRAPARGALDLAVQAAAECGAQQEELTVRIRSLTKHKRMLRRDLVRHNIGPIVTVARGRLDLFAKVQDVKTPKKTVSDAELIKDVHSLFLWAPACYEALVAQGLSPDFLDRLEAGFCEFVRAVKEHEGYLLARSKATGDIAGHLRSAWTSIHTIGALIEDGRSHLDLLPNWRATHLHAPRVARPEARIPTIPVQLALPPGSPIPVAPEPVLPPAPAAPPDARRGILAVIARALSAERAA